MLRIRESKFGQYVIDTKGRFVIPPQHHLGNHNKRNGKFVSKECKKCNHSNDSHIQYSKTDWYYCKICLRLKINNDCV